MYASSIRQKNGWSLEETNMLFHEAQLASEAGIPVIQVFSKVAEITGRKPNSIRNYYYMKLRENTGEGRINFVPFSEVEVKELVRTVLTRHAAGESVRKISCELGEGDKKMMLRYQNKYRSVVRNNPHLVQSVMKELEAEGVPFIDPYSISARRPYTSRKLTELLQGIAADLGKSDMDAELVLRVLGDLIHRASSGTAANDG